MDENRTKKILESLQIDSKYLEKIQKILDSPQEHALRKYLQSFKDLYSQSLDKKTIKEKEAEYISDEYMNSSLFNNEGIEINEEGGEIQVQTMEFSDIDRVFVEEKLFTMSKSNFKKFLKEVLDETEYDVKTYYEIFTENMENEEEKNEILFSFIQNIPYTEDDETISEYFDSLDLGENFTEERNFIVEILNSMTEEGLNNFSKYMTKTKILHKI